LARAISVEELDQKSIEEHEIEIVERKGRGHPDYIADGAAEAVSRALCRYYKEEFGLILHHNVDKGLVVGGMAHPVFGGGEVSEPISVIIAGRAVTDALKGGRRTKVPVESLAKKAIRAFLKNNFRFLDVDNHVNAQSIIRQGSVDLVKVFDEGKKMPLANDTSFGVGFAPLSETESLVFETEQYLNSPKVKKTLPELGEDIKVMGLRRKDRILLTVASPMISSLTPDLSHYLDLKEEVKNRVTDLATKKTSRQVEVVVNTADKPEKGIFYITVTGTSAERGDDGNTGRGNRINGLITPCRPMSLEATAGKNPINHVGKIYNVLAKLIADNAYNEVKGVKEVYVKILSQIGRPIDNPAATDIQVIMEPGYSLRNVKSEVYALADKEISNVRGITDLILENKVLLF
jgi:S-adenosylmethionine synthetase